MTVLRVAILQTPAPDLERADEGWRDLLARIDEAAEDGPHLVVLPEASYPAWLLDRPPAVQPSISDEQLLADLAERARRHEVHVAAGLVLGHPHAPLNAAVLIGPDGTEIARASESHSALSRASSGAPWFERGAGPAAASIRGASVALFAGGDHLDPRWVEAIAEARTQLIIATGASRGWSSQSADVEPMAGEPAGAILVTRAAETGAWIAAAGRVGIEAGAVGYAGGAGVVAPHLGWAVRAPANRPGIVLHECELGPARPGTLPVPPSTPPGGPPPGVEGRPVRVAALSLDPNPSVVELMESVRSAVSTAAALGAEVVVLPDLTGADPRSVTLDETLPSLEAVSAETRTVVVCASAERAGGHVYRAIVLVEDGRVLATHRASVLSEADRAAGFTAGPAAPPLVDTQRAGRIGLLAGREALAPAAGSGLRRAGAGMVTWCAGHDDALVQPVTQTRAWEQRIPVAGAGTAAAGAAVAGANGELLAVTRRQTPMLTHAVVDLRGALP